MSTIHSDHGDGNGHEIDALVRLLDDPDETVWRAVRERIEQIGAEGIVTLRQLSRAEDEEEGPQHDAAARMLFEIGLDRLRKGLASAVEEGHDSQNPDDLDLETAAFAVAALHYPEVDVERHRIELDTMAEVVRWRIRDYDQPIDRLHELNHYLTRDLRFRGVTRKRYHDAENSCLNYVLDQRKGIPITLSVVWLLVARRVPLSLFGVGFPVHFLVRYRSDDHDYIIDPFNGGAIITEEHCKRFLETVGIQYHPVFIEPISNREITARMLRNLVEIYRGKDERMVAALEKEIEGLG